MWFLSDVAKIMPSFWSDMYVLDTAKDRDSFVSFHNVPKQPCFNSWSHCTPYYISLFFSRFLTWPWELNSFIVKKTHTSSIRQSNSVKLTKYKQFTSLSAIQANLACIFAAPLCIWLFFLYMQHLWFCYIHCVLRLMLMLSSFDCVLCIWMYFL